MADYQHKIPSNQSGFTIVELMIVVVIMGIVAAMAYPSMQKQIAQMKVQDAANLLETALKQARSDAIIYRSNVVVTGNGTSITLTQTGNTSYPQTRPFDSKITTSSIANITFTPNKTVLNAPATMSFCYSGVSTDKYVVTVDAISNITNSKNGTCP